MIAPEDPRFESVVEALAKSLAQKLTPSVKVPKAYFSIKEAAEYCGLSHDFLRDQIYAGKLVASDVGTPNRPLWRVAKTNVDSFMAQHEAGKLRAPVSRASVSTGLPASRYWKN